MTVSILLHLLVLIIKGELIFLFGVAIYVPVRYCYERRGQLLAALAGLGRQVSYVFKRIANCSYIVLGLMAFCVAVGISTLIHNRTTSVSMPSDTTVTKPRPPEPPHQYQVSRIADPISFGLCLVRSHPAYSSEHETAVLDDMNDLLLSLGHVPLLHTVSEFNQSSREILVAQNDVSQYYVHMRNTVIPRWISLQTQQEPGLHQPEMVQDTLDALRFHHDKCRTRSSALLGDGGLAVRLSQEIKSLYVSAEFKVFGTAGKPADQKYLHFWDGSDDDEIIQAMAKLVGAGERLGELEGALARTSCLEEQLEKLTEDWSGLLRTGGRGDNIGGLRSILRLRARRVLVTLAP